MRVGATFGARQSGGGVSGGGDPGAGALTKIYDVTKTSTDAADVVNFAPESQYLLVSQTWTTSTGAPQYQTAILIHTPAPGRFGQTAVVHTNVAATTNAGYTPTWTTSSTLSWLVATNTLTTRMRIYKLN